MNSILEFFTYDPNLPLKDIFFLLLSIALRKLTTNNKNLENFSIEINVHLMPKLIISCQSPWCIQVSSAFFTKKGKQLLNWPKCRKTIVSAVLGFKLLFPSWWFTFIDRPPTHKNWDHCDSYTTIFYPMKTKGTGNYGIPAGKTCPIYGNWL